MKKLLFLILIIIFIGCGKRLPNEAIIIKKYNNGWCVFELEGRKFLHRYKYSPFRQQSLECLTELQGN